ncbi:MAG TPA: hypothetical protein VEY50_04555 [Lysobacter sp.]|nr:hypothetical protein [Lysobacter sp.]
MADGDDGVALRLLEAAIRPLRCHWVEQDAWGHRVQVIAPGRDHPVLELVLSQATLRDPIGLKWQLADVRTRLKAHGFALQPWIPPLEAWWFARAHAAPEAGIP